MVEERRKLLLIAGILIVGLVTLSVLLIVIAIVTTPSPTDLAGPGRGDGRIVAVGVRDARPDEYLGDHWEPLVEFRVVEFPVRGDRVRFADPAIASRGTYRRGEQVTVAYDPADPRRAVVADPPWGLWAACGAFAAPGVFAVAVGVKGISSEIQARRRSSRPGQ